VAATEVQNTEEIKDLTGIEHLRNLTELSLANNKLAKLIPLKLTKLQKIDLSNNELTDLEGLQYATSLTEVILVNNNLTSVSKLSGLTKLETVNVSNNKIGDISRLVSKSSKVKNIIANNQALTAKGINFAQELKFDVNTVLSLKQLNAVTDGYTVEVNLVEEETVEPTVALLNTINAPISDEDLMQANTVDWVEKPAVTVSLDDTDKKAQTITFGNITPTLSELVYELNVSATTKSGATVTFGGTITQPLQNIPTGKMIREEISKLMPTLQANPDAVKEIEAEQQAEKEKSEAESENGTEAGSENGTEAGSENGTEAGSETSTETSTTSNNGHTLASTGTPVLETMLAGGSLSLGSLGLLIRRFLKK